MNLYNARFGIRSSRRDWNNIRCLAEKDDLPEEVAFRFEHQLPPFTNSLLNRPEARYARKDVYTVGE